MREWRLTLTIIVLIVVVLSLISIGVILGFNAVIWPHLPDAFRSVITTFGVLLLAVINFLTALFAIPASLVQVRQLFGDSEQSRRIVHRQSFAKEIVRELQYLGLQEDWKDEHFAELEAEVEAEGRRRIFTKIPFLSRIQTGLRFEKSLTTALASSQERLILVEGDPGSGKSVALRHVAEIMATNATKTQSTKSIIPLYVNLKELERPEGVSIDRNLIEQFILKSLTKRNDHNLEEFLDDEFHSGMRENSWLFLFDSFDELPEVLSSTEADATIKNYGNAIDDFLGGMNRCRGVVASRQFRGPSYLGWPRFRVLPLSDARRFVLIRRLGLKLQIERKLIQELGTANEEIRSRAGNPLFLTLLCKHMKSGYPFPNSAHNVFETYIASRFTRDKDRLLRRYELNTEQLRTAAESIAFCMNMDVRLGLSPTRENLRDAMNRLNITIDGNFDTLLDALEYMKLARADVTADTTGAKTFTFAHRRFQEYFATCVVLRDRSQFKAKELLTNERWRETAVTMCQTQPTDVIKTIVREASRLLRRYCSSIPNLIDDPIAYVQNKEQEKKTKKREKDKSTLVLEPLPNFFPWPSGSLHLMNLLQDGFASRLKELPDSTRISIGKLVLTANEKGTLSDKKWALEAAGVVPEVVLTYLLKNAFSRKSQWLKDVAFRQAARLSDIPSDIAKGIRDSIINLACARRLHRERYTTEAYLSRLNQSIYFLAVMQLLLWLPRIDITLHIILFFATIFVFSHLGIFGLILALILSTIIYISFSSFRTFIGPMYSVTWFPVGMILARIAVLSVPFILIVFLSQIFAPDVGIYMAVFKAFILISIYASSFGPFAFMAAKVGKFTKVRWWILMPFWPLLYIFTSVTLLLGIILALLIITATIAFVYFGTMLFVPVLPPYTASNSTNIDILIISISVIVFGGAALIILIAFVGWVYELLVDWKRWHQWSRSHRRQMTFQELCKVVSEYHNKLFYTWVIKSVRAKRLIDTKDDMGEDLAKIARAAERKLEMDIKEENAFDKAVEALKKKRPLKKDGEDIIENLGLLGAPQEYVNLVQKANPEVVDELYILLEDIRVIKRYLSI